MAIKTMLVPLDGSAGSEAVLDTAFALARRFTAHVDVLHVRLPSDPLHSVTEGWWLSDETKQWVLEIAGRGAAEAAAKVRAAFHDYCAARDIAIAEMPPSPEAVSAAWHEAAGWEATVVAVRGRLADLIVVRRPSGEQPLPTTVEAALLETRRPIFVAPPTPAKRLGANIAIGWNGSAEAAGAIAAALPFLAAAERVTVLTARDGAPAAPEDLVRHLAWHGIAATAQTFDTKRRSVGEALLAEAQACGADLLVLGGYGRSRTREMILGGVTRHVLAASDIPLLMSH